MNAPTRHVTQTFTYLQYLRGIAALMVVYFHTVLQLKNLGVADTGLPLLGESGVDIFFVLSGFLMWITTDRSKITPREFMVNRLIRIVPLYWGLTLVASAVALLLPELLKHTKFQFSHILSSLFFVPSENPSYMEGMGASLKFTPLLVPGWTLNYEMFFYIIFAALMYFETRLRFSLILGIFLLVYLVGINAQGANSAVEFYGNAIIFEFAFGILIAILIRRGHTVRISSAVPTIIISTATLIYLNIIGATFCRAVAFGIPSAFIVYSLCCMELQMGAIKWRLLKAIGDASYSLYLTHVFTLVVCRVVFLRLMNFDSMRAELMFIVLSVTLSSIVALLVYNLYEKPAATYLKRFRY